MVVDHNVAAAIPAAMIGVVGVMKFTATCAVSEPDKTVAPLSSVTDTLTLSDVPNGVSALKVAVVTGTLAMPAVMSALVMV